MTEQIFEKGKVIRPWLGISGINLNPTVARRFGIAADSGVLMVGISRYGPVYKAGLRRSDILTQIGEVEVKQMKDLLAALSRYSIGEVLIIQFNRNGVLYRTSIRLMGVPPQIII